MKRNRQDKVILRLAATVAAGWMVVLVSHRAGAYEVVDVKDGGTVTGTVKFEGEPPRQNLPVHKNQETCGESKHSPRLVVGKSGGVENAVVYLKAVTRGKETPEVSPILDQKSCEYLPHVQVAWQGTKLEIRNSDPILHNVHGYLGGNTAFNLAMPIEGQKIRKKLKKPGIVEIACDAGHTWMSAYVFVSEHPYAATTDADGGFTLSDIPPGKYEIEMWHEGWKIQGEAPQGQRPTYGPPLVLTKEVVVEANEKATVDFLLKN